MLVLPQPETTWKDIVLLGVMCTFFLLMFYGEDILDWLDWLKRR